MALSEFLVKLAPERGTNLAGGKIDKPAPGASPFGILSVDEDDHYTIDQKFLTSMVGLIALGLPTVLYFFARSNETCFRDSISHFYYAPFWGTVFVAALAMIGAFMLAYRGNGGTIETRFARAAGIAALCVALFPTSEHGCAGEPEFSARPIVAFKAQVDGSVLVAKDQIGDAAEFMLNSYSGALHYGGAFVLFVFLLWYAAFVFTAKTKSRQTQDGGERLTPVKTTRNLLYYLSVAMIAFALFKIGQNGLYYRNNGVHSPGWVENNAMFWWEAVALWGFGLGWMIKGRVFGKFLND